MTVKVKSLFKNHNPMRDESPIVAARRNSEQRKNIEHAEYVEEKYNAIERSTGSINISNQNRINSTVFNRRLNEASNRILLEGKNKIFKKLFSDLVVESLIIDKEEVVKREAAIREMAEAFIDAEGGFALLESAVKNNNFPILVAIKEACEKNAKKATGRITKSISENKEDCDPNSINFNLTDEELTKIDYAKNEIALPEVSEVVSDKVIEVIKHEKERAKDQKNMQEAIEAEVAEEVDEEPTSEAFRVALESRIINKDILESSTLFDSTFRAVTLNALQEKSGSYDVKPVSKDEEYFETRIDYMNNQLYGGREDDDELDLILAETVLNYTILECAYTIGLKNFTHQDVKKMSEQLLNQR